MSELFAFLGICIYMLPSIIAFKASKKNAVAICVLNIFTGWTALGWIIALVWSLTKD